MLSLFVALSGCSAIKLGYATLPDLSYWWLDGYVDFDDAQTQRVREDIAGLHAWHRANELPRIVPVLARLERMAPAEVGAAQVCALEPDLRDRIAAVSQRLEPLLAVHAATLAPEQLQHLERKFAQKNLEYTREWVRLPPDELADKRLKQVVERAETLYGRLEEPQLAVLRQQLADSPYDPRRVLAERQRRQQDVLAALRQVQAAPQDAVRARRAVQGVLERFMVSPDAGWRTYADAMRRETCRVSAALHNSTTAAQREFAARRLRAWQRDLTELSAGR